MCYYALQGGGGGGGSGGSPPGKFWNLDLDSDTI